MPTRQTDLHAADPTTDLYARLGRFVRRRVSNRADADDLLQDIAVRLLSRDGPVEATRRSAWAFTVARHRIIDFYRARARQPPRADVEDGCAAGRADRHAEADRSVDLRRALEPLIRRLSMRDQQALRAVDLQGMPQTAYAASLGLDYPTAKSRVQRARQRLRRAFERCCHIVLDGRGAPVECTPRTVDQPGCGGACPASRR